MLDRRFALLIPVGLVLACGSTVQEEGQGSEAGQATVVPPGKADNYLSPTSMEYRLWGEGQLDLDESWLDKTDDQKRAQAEQLLAYKFKAYTHFINVYVTDKSSHDANHGYGGFSGLVRKSSLDSMVEPIDDLGLSYTFLWELEMGGPRALLSNLPIETNSAGEKTFRVKLPVLTESQLKYSSYPKDFNASTYSGELEEIQVAIEPEKESFDAFPEYNRLFEDGKLDILVLVGGDYNEERYDLRAADEIFQWLKRAGYAHPASRYTDLALDSPPFTSVLDVQGRKIDVEITLLHPSIVSVGDLDKLRAKIIQAYQTMDVLIYDGHAGEDPSYSGLVYHYNPRHAISADELSKISLPEKYQVYVFNGCKTYGVYPESIMKNPAKTTANVDIISTVNFSWLTMQPYTTSGFINQLLAKSAGTHDPQTYLQILRQINQSSNWNVYYGVHGLDDNPHVNPYADISSLCRSCATDADCPGVGNRCIAFSSGKACGVECTAPDGCPSGYGCFDIAEGNQIVGQQCLPKSYSCR
ncbi:MAG TPA: hypothetical protein PLJ27_04745 [Polyangiaceae bacterium]|jgi:hypothetical protein|nr:MAG: hypothetical protein BWY17_03160 [Deltaproteobacteria bacterium ADurb.Bin207]HNS96577.1 hypothetical protein [Polyangiaceae bacterium]HNZ24810.1 hypothetical protein [Polyangiaceae bacterium]HOD22026.1 hypothetical protein [Polyangiaceae bacterium]HOE47992.1 hypothetical protein [Polyangiaceae bacterium]